MSAALSVGDTYREVREAWRLSGLRTTRPEDYRRMIEGLLLILVRCPDECESLVRAAIINAERREFHVMALTAGEETG